MNNSDPPELQIPSWCPANISSLAQSLYKKHRASQLATELIKRLVTYPEMKQVWRELRKQVRENYQKTTIPYHKANRLLPSQDDAIEELFSQAFYNGGLNLALPSRETDVDWAQEAAKNLRADADRISTWLPRKSGLPMVRPLLKAAKAYERLHYKEHDKVLGIAINIAAVMKAIFGSPMLKTTATITSVITETRVTGRMVRTWRDALSRSRARSKSNPAKTSKKKP